MTIQEKVCQRLWATGQHHRIICDAYCTKVKQTRCKVLEMINIAEQEQEHKFDETREMAQAETKGE